MKTKQKIFGNQCLMVTPFEADGSLDEASLRRLVDHLIARGVHGIIAAGSTGEFFTMTIPERFKMMEIICEQARGRVPVSFGCGGTSTMEAVSLIEKAAAVGADAVLVQPPFYNPGFFSNGQVMLRYFETLSTASSLPLILYDGGGGMEIPYDLLRRLITNLGNVRYIKVTVPYPAKVKLLVEEIGDRVSPLCGTDSLPLPMLASGAKGFSLGIGNVLPAETSEFYQAYIGGRKEDARRIYYTKLLPMINVALGSTSEFIQCFKQVLCWQGVIASPAVRGPLLPLDAARLEELRAVCRLVGLQQ